MKNKHKNPVLIKDLAGQVRQSTYDLPPQSHAYGKKLTTDPKAMKSILSDWDFGKTKQSTPPKNKNFIALNRKSTENGLHTSKEQAYFRKYNDIMVKPRKAEKNLSLILPSQQFSYGVPNRPSTPMRLVIGNSFSQVENEQELNFQEKRRTSPKKNKSQLLREEKVGKQREFRAKPMIEDEFKLKKYKEGSGSKINTNLLAKAAKITLT